MAMLASLYSAVLLAIVLLQGASGPCRGSAVHYGPAVTELTGILVMEHVFGPPNFGETPRVDARYIIPVLHLDSAVCVIGDPSSQINTDTISDVRRVQLFAGQVRYKFSAFAGQHVTVQGTLEQSVTPGEYTRIFIDVQTLVRSARARPSNAPS